MSTLAAPQTPTPAESPDSQVWQLLCACALAELDTDMEGVRGADLAARLQGLPRYRALDPKAAAYLWFVSETTELRAPD